MKDNLSVLYVEDDKMSRRVMQMLLAGKLKLKNVTILENSEDFLEKAVALTPVPDVVFLDIHVEPLDGFEMLKLLRESQTFNDTPVVAMTASVMNEEVVQLQQAGFDGCIAKPIDKNEFPYQLERILAGEKIWSILY